MQVFHILLDYATCTPAREKRSCAGGCFCGHLLKIGLCGHGAGVRVCTMYFSTCASMSRRGSFAPLTPSSCAMYPGNSRRSYRERSGAQCKQFSRLFCALSSTRLSTFVELVKGVSKRCKSQTFLKTQRRSIGRAAPPNLQRDSLR